MQPWYCDQDQIDALREQQQQQPQRRYRVEYINSAGNRILVGTYLSRSVAKAVAQDTALRPDQSWVLVSDLVNPSMGDLYRIRRTGEHSAKV